ncbi:hypothetical protein H1Q59_06655 [Holosporaceae bacterium 'Namur']|nr:hypothetical protein [Holosporaceae bacterium 'Namur']
MNFDQHEYDNLKFPAKLLAYYLKAQLYQLHGFTEEAISAIQDLQRIALEDDYFRENQDFIKKFINDAYLILQADHFKAGLININEINENTILHKLNSEIKKILAEEHITLDTEVNESNHQKINLEKGEQEPNDTKFNLKSKAEGLPFTEDKIPSACDNNKKGKEKPKVDQKKDPRDRERELTYVERIEQESREKKEFQIT